jgi:hypothetical protein
MISDDVATQNNVVCGVCSPDAIASSAWRIDIHPMRRVAVLAADSPLHANTAMNEGQTGFNNFPGNGTIWEVRYGTIVPKRCVLFVNVHLWLRPCQRSCSHVLCAADLRQRISSSPSACLQVTSCTVACGWSLRSFRSAKLQERLPTSPSVTTLLCKM